MKADLQVCRYDSRSDLASCLAEKSLSAFLNLKTISIATPDTTLTHCSASLIIAWISSADNRPTEFWIEIWAFLPEARS
jgi:hypothetical protein